MNSNKLNLEEKEQNLKVTFKKSNCLLMLIAVITIPFIITNM